MAAYRIALSRNKALEGHQMPPADSSEIAEEHYTLLTLQNHVLERIFLRLHLTDLARCCQVCKDLQSLVQQDSIWQSLCTAAFPSFTVLELKQWIIPTVRPSAKQRASAGFRELPLSSPASSSSASQRPTTYRQLYPILKQLEPLIGIWKHDRNAARPVLFMFDWGTQCVEGRKLCYDLPGQDPFVEPFQQVGPGSSASVQHVDSMHCLLTVQTGAPRSPITRAVQAATAVAVGGIPIPKRDQTHDVMGTSPEGSFEFEMQRFMQGHIAEKKQAKRRRSGHRSSSGTLPVVHTLTRVEMPIPTQRHPLAGIWRSTGMHAHTCIMDVRYDFTTRAATIAATQVQGLQSLLQRWKMRAAPAAKPWPAGYTSMLSRQAEMAMLNGDFEHFDETGAELLAGKEVVQIFQGEVGIIDLQVMLPGYLWLYADGTFGVLFDTWDGTEALVNMQRIDDDLLLR
ncbi:F-box only protein 31 [Trebouxia sp. C0009 RCD-2024]